MLSKKSVWQEKGLRSFLACFLILTGVFLTFQFFRSSRLQTSNTTVLRIYNWKTDEIYAEIPAKAEDRLFFGWIHSLEKIPWNEYYHIDQNHDLILDAITFPAFGAGIPENKGSVCYVKDGLIHMEKIDQKFSELVWLNSHTATRDILLNDKIVTRGSDLPQHTRLKLVIERSGVHVR